MAFEDFFHEVEPKLRAALVARHGSYRGREATAEALTWAWEHQDELPGIKSPLGYLYRVGTTRTSSRHPFMAILHGREEQISFEPTFEPKLASLLGNLPRQQRVATVLVHGYGLTLKETAAFMGIKITSVQNHATRGLEKLRRGLGTNK